MKKLIVFLYSSFFITFCSNLNAQIEWTKYEENPVLEPGATGEWDDESLFPFSIFFDGSTYHMWYGGFDGTVDQVGYATSPEGITWDKYEDNPVLPVGTAGEWDDSGVGSPCVLFDGGIYHMWYDGLDGTYKRIGYATSPDGISWTKHEENPVIDRGSVGSWMEIAVVNPFIRFDGNTYYMWFDGWSASDTGKIGYATSLDGISWILYEGNPIFEPESGKWDSRRVEDPHIIFDGNLYHMWYTGGTTTSFWFWRIGYATSPDGITWEKNVNNPILAPTAGSWDSQWVGYCNVLWDSLNSQYKMWYGGGSGSLGKFGYATAPDTITGLSEGYSAVLPRNFVLMQNYPNPFNPLTMINYQLPMISDVELGIYNILGQKLATLVNERQQAGFHQIEWDASGCSSGIYYYRIEAGNFVHTRKMIYLK